jgi:hypothetical protein
VVADTLAFDEAGVLENFHPLFPGTNPPRIPSDISVVGDVTPPVTTANFAGTLGANVWYRGPVMVTLSATDADSSVAATYFSLDSGPIVTYSAPFTVSGDGLHQLSFYGTDPSGNQEKPNLLRSRSTRLRRRSPLRRTLQRFGPPTETWFPSRSPVRSQTPHQALIRAAWRLAVTDEYGVVHPSGPVTLGTNGNYSFSISLQASRLDTFGLNGCDRPARSEKMRRPRGITR